MIYLIGTGMDGVHSLTQEAKGIIEKTDIIIGAKRMLEPYQNMHKRMFQTYDSNYISAILHSELYNIAVVLFSGDVSFFSGTKKLYPLISDLKYEIIPGISSISASCAKFGISYEDLHIVSLHGTEQNIVIPTVFNLYTFYLLSDKHNISYLCNQLCKYGQTQLKIYFASCLGYDNETIMTGTVLDFVTMDCDDLAIAIVENNASINYTCIGIADDQFIRAKVPMTKSFIRSNIISLMKISRNSVCWDIGSGTGSISIEMAYQAIRGSVWSFDVNPEAIQLTNQNAVRFHCDNIHTIEGLCPNTFQFAPKPDKVIIGGTKGNLSSIIESILQINPLCDILITAISLETLNEAILSFDRHNINYKVIQLSSVEYKKIGYHTMPNVQNPVYIIYRSNT